MTDATAEVDDDDDDDDVAYPRASTNTACQMVVNMLNLMAYYLNEKLPFTMIDQGTASFAYRSLAGGDTR